MATDFKALAKTAKKDPASIKALANQYLATGDKTLVGWANSALQNIKNYEEILATGRRGALSHGEYKYADSAAFAQSKLDSAFHWISGAAQPYKGAVLFGETPKPAPGSFAATHTPEEVAAVNTKGGVKTPAPTSGIGTGASLGINDVFKPTDYSTSSGLSDLQKNVMSADAIAKANNEFINGAFKAFHNRDATQAELDAYRDKPVGTVRNEIIGGAQAAKLPTVAPGTVNVPTGMLTPEQAKEQGLQRVLRPDQLGAFSEDQIVRDNAGGIYLRAGAVTTAQAEAVAAGKNAAGIIGRPETPGASADASLVEGGAGSPDASGFMDGTAGSGATPTEIVDTIAGSATGFLEKQLAALDAQIAGIEADRLAAKDNLNQLTNRINEMAFGDTREKELNRAINKYDLADKRDRLNEVLSNIENEKAKLNLGLIQERDKLAPLSIIGTRQNALREQAMATIGALSSVAQIYQDDLNFAKDMVDATMDAINADRTDQLNALDFLVGLAQDNIVELSDDERAVITSRSDIITEAMKNAQDNADKVFDLIKQYPEAAVSARVSLLDSPALALSKMAPYMAEQGSDGRTQVIDLGGRKVLIDLNTGKEIQSYTDTTGSGGSGGGGGSSGSDFTAQEERKLETEFGPEWETSTTREQQLEFIYGKDATVEIDYDYAREIIYANSHESFFGEHGVLKDGVTEAELVTALETQAGLSSTEAKSFLQDVLDNDYPNTGWVPGL